MAYQGEDWVFTITGDDKTNLDNNDFKILVYPCGKSNISVSTITKEQCSQVKENVYTGTIPFQTTKNLEIGLYTVEVLLISSGNVRSVFMKNNAFENKPSESKNIE